MENTYHIRPLELNKLSDSDLIYLLENKIIVDAHDPSVLKHISLDGTQDQITEEIYFFPYTHMFESNQKTYMVYDEWIENLQEEIWQSFRNSSIQRACDLAVEFENTLELELEDNKLTLLEKFHNVSKDQILASPITNIKRLSVTQNLKTTINSYVIDCLEHQLCRLFNSTGSTLDKEFENTSQVYSHYIFIQYLKWRIPKISEDVINGSQSFFDVIYSILQPEDRTETTFFQNPSIRLTQREISLLLQLANKKRNFMECISKIDEVTYQFIGILTDQKPRSFAKELSRNKKILENQRDKKYLENLLTKFKDETLTKAFKNEFKNVVDEIESLLSRYQTI